MPSSDPASSDRPPARTAVTIKDGSTGSRWHSHLGSRSQSGIRCINSIDLDHRPSFVSVEWPLRRLLHDLVVTEMTEMRAHIRTRYMRSCMRKAIGNDMYFPLPRGRQEKKEKILLLARYWENCFSLHFYRYISMVVRKIRKTYRHSFRRISRDENKNRRTERERKRGNTLIVNILRISAHTNRHTPARPFVLYLLHDT